MKKLLLICGHQNIKDLTNESLRSWRDVTYLRRSTGAAGEMSYQSGQIAPLIEDELKDLVDITITDAIYHKDIYDQDYDLVIALHYDGGGIENRCIITSPDDKTVPAYICAAAREKADQFCSIFKGVYPDLTGTVNRDGRITDGMKEYYAWDYVSIDSPSVIIEQFNHTSERGAYLKVNPNVVVDGIIQCICKYFEISPEENPEPTECEETLEETKEKLAKSIKKEEAWKIACRRYEIDIANHVEIGHNLEEKIKRLQAVIAGAGGRKYEFELLGKHIRLIITDAKRVPEKR